MRQAVLLAAGIGSRLLPFTSQIPKCLVPLAGGPLIEHLLRALQGLEVEELLVVTGWQHQRLVAHLGHWRGGMRIRYVHNARFRETNNILSLHLAAPLVRAPFMLLESDLYLHPAALEHLRSADRMLVARYAPDMQGTGVTMDPRGRVHSLKLQAHELCSAERATLWKTVNAYTLSPETWRHLRPGIARRIREGHTHLYYEAELARLVQLGEIELRAIDITDLPWYEIDDAADLARAERLFSPAAASAEAPRPQRAESTSRRPLVASLPSSRGQ